MAVAFPLDLSNLYRHPVFHSRSAVESHHELSRALTEHQLRWGRGDVATSLYRRELSRISLMVLSYGAEVEITPSAFKDFVLVQMPLSGAAEVECDGVNMRVGTGDVAVLAPQHDVRLLWQPQCEQLILKLPADLLHQGACHKCAVSHRPSAPSQCQNWLDPVFKVPPQLSDQWRALVQQLLLLLPQHSSMLHPLWIKQLEETAALFLQSHQPSILQHETRERDGLDGLQVTASAASARLDQLEAYMRSRLFAPISLADLARAAGVSPRTLNVICQRHRGVAPMVLLRNLRLEAARRKLLSDPRASVTDVALEYGFGHLGRFSAYYRERFGELPRETRLDRH